uniref:40S ribosomal protein S8 n=1 Tax=Cebus imitator TaxID=2715852 RepID=A0A2K5SAE5_CEBIM
HKCGKPGGKRKPYHKKQKYELGHLAANTKTGPRHIHTVCVWYCCTRKTRIIDVVYNASNNEPVGTKTLVKNCIVLIDSTPYQQWYKSHYALPLGSKKGKKYDKRKKNAKISLLEEQFQQEKRLASIASRRGHYGYVLEGKELEFYLRKIKVRKGKKILVFCLHPCNKGVYCSVHQKKKKNAFLFVCFFVLVQSGFTENLHGDYRVRR